MTDSNCSSFMTSICAIGGRCEREFNTLEETCMCDPGFGPDRSVLHNEIADCSLPSSAYLGWLLFQTMANAVVAYRLAKKVNSSKGRIRAINIYWCLILVASWVYILGLTIQGGMYEVGSIALAAIVSLVNFGGFEMAKMFVEARYAASMSSPRNALRRIQVIRSLFAFGFVIIGIVQAIYSRTPYVNIIVLTFLSGVLLFGFVISITLLVHIQLLAGVLKSMIKNQDSGGDMIIDEKPALIKRLALFRHVVLIGNVCVIAPVIFLLGIFSSYHVYPLMWACLIFVWQFFPVTGLYLNTLNELIRGFKSAKIRATVANSPPGATTMPIAIAAGGGRDAHAEQVRLALSISSPFYGKYRMLSKIHYLEKTRSVTSHYCGQGALDFGMKVTQSIWYKSLVSILGPTLMILAVVVLFREDLLDLNAIIVTGVVTIALVVFGILTIMNKAIFQRGFMYCAAVQLRIILLLAAILSASATLNWSLRSLVVAFLDLTTLLFIMFDFYRKDPGRGYYEFLILFFTSSVPFFMWFILAFDFLDGRVNYVIVSGPNGYVWSLYHFTMDVHAFIVWCVFVDINRLIRNSGENYLHFSCPLNIRYVKLKPVQQHQQSRAADQETLQYGDGQRHHNHEGRDLRDGEVDFALTDTSDPAQSTASSPMPRRKTFRPPSRRETINLATISDEKRTTIAKRVVIREEDSILRFMCYESTSMIVLHFQETYSPLINLISGIVVGVCLGVWARLVVVGTTPEGVSLGCLAGIVLVLTWRLMFKSIYVLMYLIYRLEFFYDVCLVCIVLGFMGTALGGSLAVVPGLLALGLLFIDWRTGDASVLPRATSPMAVGYFLPALVGFLVLPSMVFGGQVPGVSEQTFVLIPPLNATEVESIPNVFAQYNPPQSALSRIRFSQIVFDSLFAFALKLILDFVQHLVQTMKNRSRKNDTPVLDYLRSTVAPVLVDKLVASQDLEDVFSRPPSDSTTDPLGLATLGEEPNDEDTDGDHPPARQGYSKAGNPQYEPKNTSKEPNSSVVPVSDIE